MSNVATPALIAALMSKAELRLAAALVRMARGDPEASNTVTRLDREIDGYLEALRGT